MSDFMAEVSAFQADSADEQVAAQREELAARVGGLMGAAGEGAEIVIDQADLFSHNVGNGT